MAADEAYERESNQQGLYPLMYMPHNPHFLCYTASMEGRGDYALEVARQMAWRITEKGEGSGLGTLQHYWATPLYVMARFGRWAEILEVPEPHEAYLLMRNLEAQGRDDDAAAVRRRFEAAWSRADVDLAASRF